jgi:hypothetical protein
LGKQDNCQVAVSLPVATHRGNLPVAYRLYLPKDWADDAARRAIAGVPDEVCFRTKPEIALQLLRPSHASIAASASGSSNCGSSVPKERNRSMGHSESHLVHELRKVIAELREKCDVQERQIEELRDAVAALMEQDMPRILCTRGGIMVLDKKAHNKEWSRH